MLNLKIATLCTMIFQRDIWSKHIKEVKRDTEIDRSLFLSVNLENFFPIQRIVLPSSQPFFDLSYFWILKLQFQEITCMLKTFFL